MDTWLEIDLSKLANNFNYMKSKTKTGIISVVKANAYGMGSVRIAQELEILGTDMFAVATYEEAEELRMGGIKKEILILNETSSENLKNSIDKNYIFTIFNLYYLKKWINDIGENIKKLKFHIKVDTGMNRLGFKLKGIGELSELIEQNNIRVDGVYSHFAAAETDEEFTEQQFINFNEIINKFEKNDINFKYKHLANSAAGLKYDKYNLNFVRIGMALYGLQPLNEHDSNIQEIFTWKSKIIEIRKVKKGERISYSSKPLIDNKRIGVIPVGYAQGYMRQLSESGYVVCNEIKCRILGSVCMEKIIIDLTNIAAEIDDRVILLGNDVSIQEKSSLAFTIGDDILCKLSNRVERIYKDY